MKGTIMNKKKLEAFIIRKVLLEKRIEELENEICFSSPATRRKGAVDEFVVLTSELFKVNFELTKATKKKPKFNHFMKIVNNKK